MACFNLFGKFESFLSDRVISASSSREVKNFFNRTSKIVFTNLKKDCMKMKIDAIIILIRKCPYL